MMELSAGKKLDALIAEKVLGWMLVDGLGYASLVGGKPDGPLVREMDRNHVPNYSSNIAAAGQVIIAVRDDGLWWALNQMGNVWVATLSNPERTRFINSKARSVPLAICRTALKAVAPDAS